MFPQGTSSTTPCFASRPATDPQRRAQWLMCEHILHRPRDVVDVPAPDITRCSRVAYATYGGLLAPKPVINSCCALV